MKKKKKDKRGKTIKNIYHISSSSVDHSNVWDLIDEFNFRERIWIALVAENL